ncbi:MAG: metal-sulfur cluster assembly factor [Betaproteobacteria bacterium]|nr:metal-sulfur cluster assembly factor [Betaproteobacteria bacterium]
MATSASADPEVDTESLFRVLHSVMDPELGMNIVDLGLVYRIDVADDTVTVDLTMTSPACPMGEMIVEDVYAVLRETLPSSLHAIVNLVWSPPWAPSMMSDAAKRHFHG